MAHQMSEFTPALVSAWIEESISTGRMSAGTAKSYRRGATIFFASAASTCGVALDEEQERAGYERILARSAPHGRPGASVTEHLLSDLPRFVQQFVDRLYLSQTDRRKAQELISQLRNLCGWLRDKGWTSLDPSTIENPIVVDALVTLPIVRAWTSEWTASGRLKRLTAQNYRNAVMQFAQFIGSLHKIELNMVYERRAFERLRSAQESAVDEAEAPTITEWLCGSRLSRSLAAYLRHLRQQRTPAQEGTAIVSNLRMFVEWLHTNGLTEIDPGSIENPFVSANGPTVHPIVSEWLDSLLSAGRLTKASAGSYERKVRSVINAIAESRSCVLDVDLESKAFAEIKAAAPERWRADDPERQSEVQASIAAVLCTESETAVPQALTALAESGAFSQVMMNQLASALRKLYEFLGELRIPVIDPQRIETPKVAEQRSKSSPAPAEAPEEQAVPEQTRASSAAKAKRKPTAEPKQCAPKAPKPRRQGSAQRPKKADKRPAEQIVQRLVIPRRGIPSDLRISAAVNRRNRLITALIRDDARTFREIRDWRYADFDPASTTLAVRDQNGRQSAWRPKLDTVSLLLAYHRSVVSCALARVWQKELAPFFISADGGELTVDDELKPNSKEWTLAAVRDTAITQLVSDGLEFAEIGRLTTGSLIQLSHGQTALAVFDAAGNLARQHPLGAMATESLRTYVEALRAFGMFQAGHNAPLFMGADRGQLTADDVLGGEDLE